MSALRCTALAAVISLVSVPLGCDAGPGPGPADGGPDTAVPDPDVAGEGDADPDVFAGPGDADPDVHEPGPDAEIAVGPAASTLFGSGERLRARLVRAADGSSAHGEGLLIGWRDTALDIDCEVVPAVDGNLYCLPIQTGVLRVFQTPTCAPESGAARLYGPSGQSCADGYGTYMQGGAESCGYEPRYGVVALGAQQSGSLATYAYVRTADGACNKLGPPPGDPNPPYIYCEMAEAPLETFVAAQVTSTQLGDLRLDVQHTEDGAFAPLGLFHDTFDAGLYPYHGQLMPDNSAVPQVSGPGFSFFSDADCTQPVVCSPPSCAGALHMSDADFCNSTIIGLGGPVTSLYGPAQGIGCGPQPNPYGGEIQCYAATETYPGLPYDEVAVGAGRLRSLWISYQGHVAEQLWELWDTELGTRCTVDRQSSGPLTCHPPTIWDWEAVFEDASCETRIGYAYRGPSCDAPSPVVYGQLGGYTQPTGLYRMLALDLPIPERTYTRNGQPEGGQAFNCTENEAAPAELFVAEPLDEGLLAEAEIVVD